MGALRNARVMAHDLWAGRYPACVYGRRPKADEAPPVFCFHTADPETFPAICEHLAAGGYRTLTCRQYLDRVAGRTPIDPRDVLITFDDGHLSVWSVAVPLLRQHGLTAVSFLIPGRMASEPPVADRVRPTLDDVAEGRATLEEIAAPLRDSYALATWAEVDRMHRSGVIDCQAHTLHHRLIVASDRIVGFVNPTLKRTAHPFELAMLAPPADAADPSELPMPPLGTPIYASASRVSDTPAVTPDPAVADACTQLVEREGGEAFFESKGWPQRLHDAATAAATQPPPRESDTEQARAIAFDLTECRSQIEDRLPGHEAVYLAYPWGVGGRLATRAARDAGYHGAFWGRVDGRLTNRVGTDPLHLARIGENFFWTLAGPGHRPLTRILFDKFTARWRKGSAYVSH